MAGPWQVPFYSGPALTWHPVLDRDPAPATDHTGLRHLGAALNRLDSSRGQWAESGDTGLEAKSGNTP